MSATGSVDPFGTGPFQALLNAVGLPAGRGSAVGRRAVLAVLVAWVPLVVLAQAQGLAIGTGEASLLQDFGAYTRFLVAVPLLVVAEAPARRWLHRVLDHFVDARLIAPEDDARFGDLLTSTRRLLSSRVALVVIVVLAYTMTLASVGEWVAYGAANWTILSHDTNRPVVSYAGWWRVLVSQPLFLSLALTWFWRLFLWMRSMRAIARMKVRIVPSHPDRAGGLGFMGQSLRGFPLLAVALAAAIAGTLANLVRHDQRAVTQLLPVAGVTVLFILLISVGPLLAFIKPMVDARDDAELTYGALATSLGERFEDRWLARVPDIGDEALGVPDFSATTDLYSVVAQVDNMRPIPIQVRDFLPLLAATLVPFLPIVLRQVSFTELLEVGKRLLM